VARLGFEMLAMQGPKSGRQRTDLPDESAAQVTRQDLDRLGVLHDLLRVLNDPLAGAQEIAHHVARMPPLRARVTRDFGARFPARAIPKLPEQVAALGNREIEKILLALLEDLTVLRAEIE